MGKGDVVIVNKELNYFRFHENNTTYKSLIKGVGDYEHKYVFDYLVRCGYIEKKDRLSERQRWIRSYVGRDYSSKRIKVRVLEKWDRFYFYRIILKLDVMATGIKKRVIKMRSRLCGNSCKNRFL